MVQGHSWTTLDDDMMDGQTGNVKRSFRNRFQSDKNMAEVDIL